MNIPLEKPLTVIITGASDGIGKAIALSFAKRGARLGLIARRKELLMKVAEECKEGGSPQTEIAVLDVTDSAIQRDGLTLLENTLGPIDFFIANAGKDTELKIRTDNAQAIKELFDLNVHAAIDGIEFMKPKMIYRGHGSLCVVTSVAGSRGLPFAGPYCATKAAMHAYLESLRFEMEPLGIKVQEIAPGFIRTALTSGNEFPMPLLMEVETAGDIFVTKLLKGKEWIIAPTAYYFFAWLLKATPHPVYNSLMKWMLRGRKKRAKN